VQDALWDFESEGSGTSAPRRPPVREARRYQRRGLDRCPKCDQPVEVFPIALGEGYDAVVPGEYPSARVAEEAARHVVRGKLWSGRDSGGWSRIAHRAVCPDEAMPEDPELLRMWRALRVRRQARLQAGPVGETTE
jgi:hypothetical protein